MTRVALLLPLLLCLASPTFAKQPTAAQLKQAFVLHLEDNGEILTDTRELLTPRQLLSRAVRKATEYNVKTNVAPDPEPGDLPVVLHVVSNVPWEHVQIVLGIVARTSCSRVWLARPGKRKSRYFDAVLPKYRGVPYRKGPGGVLKPLERPVVQVEFVPVTATIQRRSWRVDKKNLIVPQPTAVTYRIDAEGDHGNWMEVGGMISARATALLGKDPANRPRAIVCISSRTPFHLVAQGLEMFDRSLFPYVEFLAAPDLTRAAWDKLVLSYPLIDTPAAARARVIGEDSLQTFLVAPWSGSSNAIDTAEAKKVGDGNPVDASVRLPLGPGNKVDSGPFEGDRVVVNLTRDGAIRANGFEFSLRVFTVFFRALVATRATGEEKKSAPRVLLRVDGEAPWAHVLTLLSVLNEHGIREVEMGVRLYADEKDSDRDVRQFDAPRPGESLADATSTEGYVSLKLHSQDAFANHAAAPGVFRMLDRSLLDIRAERMVETRWGPKDDRQKVMMPLNVRFNWGAMRTYSLREILRGMIKDRATRFRREGFFQARATRCLVSASEKVPARFVITALARLRSMAWTEIRVYAPYRPFAGADSASTLPYPRTNRLIRVDDGLGVFSRNGQDD